MKFSKLILSGALVSGLVLSSCVKVSTSLGQNFRPFAQQYEVFAATKPIERMQARPLENLSAYNQYRITVGAINDGVASARRSSAFTLVPCYKKLYFGKNPRIKSMMIDLVKDTLNVIDESQKSIIQNIHVYSLKDAGVVLDSSYVYTNQLSDDDILSACSREITKGTPTYSGERTLDFLFSDEFAGEFLQGLLDKSAKHDSGYVCTVDSLDVFTREFPGIYLMGEESLFKGGRINMFMTSPTYSQDNYLDGSFCRLAITADFGERKDVDTSYMFLFGAREIVSETSNGKTNHYAFNVSEEHTIVPEGDGTYFRIQGGMGDKPVISGRELRNLMMEMFDEAGIDTTYSDEVIINKATVNMPFDFPEDYNEINMYPDYLSATCKFPAYFTVEGKDTTVYYTYINLADANVAEENHGDINRSTCSYNPDFTFHAQKLLQLSREDAADDSKIRNYDLWFMIQANELITTYNLASTSQSDYLNQLYYASYLNQMYGGYGGYGGYGYGGMGGYGSYGYDYNNYYNMMYYSSMLQQASTTSSSTSNEVMLDRDRFYRGTLLGPKADGDRHPSLSVTFSVPADILKK